MRSIYRCYASNEPHQYLHHPLPLSFLIFFLLINYQLIITLSQTFPLIFTFSFPHDYLSQYHSSYISLSSFIFNSSYSHLLTIICNSLSFYEQLLHTKKLSLSLSFFYHFLVKFFFLASLLQVDYFLYFFETLLWVDVIKFCVFKLLYFFNLFDFIDVIILHYKDSI